MYKHKSNVFPNFRDEPILWHLCWSALPNLAQLYFSSMLEGKDETHLLSEGQRVHNSPSNIS